MLRSRLFRLRLRLSLMSKGKQIVSSWYSFIVVVRKGNLAVVVVLV